LLHDGTDTAGDSGVSDIGELYRHFSARLEQIVRCGVRSSDAVVEDACQFAWGRLVLHHARVREETAVGWLVKTAIREAFKLSRRGARELSLDEALETGIDPVSPAPGPWELLVQREQVSAVRTLPVARQRIVWLKALGFSYSEISQLESCTPRTIDRHLGRARSALRGAASAGEGAPADADASR
jgi:DNA-directed RNA polymerase specialized sigma24 family protein